MADEPNQTPYEEIQRDLVRTAIKQPLLAIILEAKDKAQPIPIIVEANDEYYAGKDQGVKEVQNLVKKIAGVELPSIGSGQNPYYKTSLTPQQILDIVDQDDLEAPKRRKGAMKKEEQRRLESPTQAAATPPKQLARYLAILRIWYNHPINPLIDKSVRITGLPRSSLSDSVWSGVTCKVKSGASVPAGKIFDMRPPSRRHPDYCIAASAYNA